MPDRPRTITIETFDAGNIEVKYQHFVDGELRCPPKDAGGMPDFEMFFYAIADFNQDECGVVHRTDRPALQKSHTQ